MTKDRYALHTAASNGGVHAAARSRHIKLTKHLDKHAPAARVQRSARWGRDS
jgi:hypothetical protein